MNGLGVFVLSANHIFADTNRAFLDDPVLQPGSLDGGRAPYDEVATLFDFEPIEFGGVENVIDAAIALTTLEEVDNATPDDGYGVPSSTTVRPRPRMRVMKYGRTTGLTKGRIEAIDGCPRESSVLWCGPKWSAPDCRPFRGGPLDRSVRWRRGAGSARERGSG